MIVAAISCCLLGGFLLFRGETVESGTDITLIADRVELPRQSTEEGYRSSDACQECHEDQHASWHASFHRTMTQVATPPNIVAPFDNIRLRSRGRSYTLFRDGDRFFIRMPDPDFEAVAASKGTDLTKINPPVVEKEIVMTTGSHRMQEYWVGSEEPNLLRQIPWVYLIEDQQWVPREDIFIIPPDSPRHFVTWNNNCIVCHATRGNPNFDAEAMTMQTQVAELGIACESCHGPGQDHIDYHRLRSANPEAEPTSSVGEAAIASTTADPILNPANCDSATASEICAQCHSAFTPKDENAFASHGYDYQPGDDLLADRNPITFASAIATGDEKKAWLFWNDGTCRVSGREFSAMKDSGCSINGQMTCISCHSMHESDPNDQLGAGMETNQACTQCHPAIGEQLEAHTHHGADSVGSQCYNCHMPNSTFGLLTAMRNHRIQSPRIAGNEKSDQPNACNLCHLDQTVDWTASKLSQWYDHPEATLDEDSERVAAGPLWLLKGDAVQRSLAAWHMSWPEALEASQSEWQAPLLAQLLTDEYAVVRYVAEHSLEAVTGQELDYNYVGAWHETRAVQNQWLERWQNLDVAEIDEAGRERLRRLLFEAEDGNLNQDAIKKLLEQQDRRPIMLPE